MTRYLIENEIKSENDILDLTTQVIHLAPKNQKIY